MRSLRTFGQDLRWAVSQLLNADIGAMSLKWKLVTAVVSCGIWAVATFIYGKVVMV